MIQSPILVRWLALLVTATGPVLAEDAERVQPGPPPVCLAAADAEPTSKDELFGTTDRRLTDTTKPEMLGFVGLDFLDIK